MRRVVLAMGRREIDGLACGVIDAFLFSLFPFSIPDAGQWWQYTSEGSNLWTWQYGWNGRRPVWCRARGLKWWRRSTKCMSDERTFYHVELGVLLEDLL